jgi:putative transposase
MDNSSDHTFFVTSITWHRRPIFRSERAARLFIHTVYGYREHGTFELYEFVVMPDHFHLLLSPKGAVALERAMQFIKSGFSHRLRKEMDSRMKVWERSFTNHRIRDERDYEQHLQYIRKSPVLARFVETPEEYPYSSAHPGFTRDAAPHRLRSAW